MKVLVTGSAGFIGKNLLSRLKTIENIEILEFTRANSSDELTEFVISADFIYHTAGVNRPADDAEFTTGNKELTEKIINILRDNNKKTPLLITSSSQAELDNLYGKSKLAAETAVLDWQKESDSQVYIYRLPGVFGKWGKPNYNSVVATFCHNIANNLPVEVSDPSHEITLVYIDTVIDEFIKKLDSKSNKPSGAVNISQVFKITLGDLKDRITKIHDVRSTLIVPNLDDLLNKYLYATYTSYLSKDNFSYELQTNADNRGSLTEFIKSRQFGQIFTSKTKPGISRGDHWHHTKVEKFFVVEGEAEITFRNKINDQDILTYKVSGETPTVLDIPTGYVHAIKNVGDTDLITIFWANEMLNKEYPDTYYEKVEIGD